jgi:hypothetical protein
VGASRQWLGVRKPASDSLEADEPCDVVGFGKLLLEINRYERTISFTIKMH